jgi:hypothetical protein
VDAYADPESATIAAGQLLKENYGSTHSWDDAVRMYHGGTNRRNWGPQNRAYAARVGSFDEGQSMPQRSLYDGPDIPGSFDPHYVDPMSPEPPRDAVPVPGDPGPSRSTTAAAPLANKKRRGILGTIGHVLGEVFMPQPDSLWAGALRVGIVNARESQANYKASAEKGELNNMLLQAKVKQLLTKGDYQVVGNNVFHFPADGGEPQIITPPQTKSEKLQLIDMWKAADDSDPAKELIRRMLLGANSDEVLENRETTARTRAGATTSAARIRAANTSKGPTVTIPEHWTVVK